MIKKVVIKKLFICSVAMCLSALLMSCGTGTSGENRDPDHVVKEDKRSGAASQREYVYVPERIVLRDEKADYGKMYLAGDEVCYVTMNGEAAEEVQNIGRYSLAKQELIVAPIQWPIEERIHDICACVFNPDHSVWMLINAYPEDYGRLIRYLCRFDQDGSNTFCQDVTEQLGSGISIDHMALDSQGRLYVFTIEAGVCLYQEDGSWYGSIPYDSENVWVRGSAEGADGRFYVCVGRGEQPEHCVLMEADFEKKQLVEVVEEFPNADGLCTGASGRYDLVWYDHDAVYGYDFSSQKRGGKASEELFVWADSDINGYFTEALGALEDGRYFAMIDDWAGEDRSIVLLIKTRAEEAPVRKDLTLATINGGSDLTGMAVAFNRDSIEWHITVKNYASLNELYNAILAGETMDIIDLSGANARKLAAQGVLEDIGAWVDGSDAFDRSDFLDGILDVYEFDGILTGIPESFSMKTVVGDRTQLENNAGLSLEELLADAGENPGALPFDGITKEEMMRYLMMFNEDVFIDWNTGECRFDSETFIELLKLVNRFPDSVENREEEISLPNKLLKGDVQYAIVDVWGFRSFQVYEAVWGEHMACVGFPTKEGDGGTLCFPDNVFGIAARSENKSGAWEFIEGILTREKNQFSSIAWGHYPVLKEDMNRIVEDEFREDEERAAKGRGLGKRTFREDGWTFSYRAVTWDDSNEVQALLRDASPFYDTEDDEIIKIISEEAQAYYQGQKKAADVAEVIQNRVSLYVSENIL